MIHHLMVHVPGSSEGQICIHSETEAEQILESCHTGVGGAPFGRDKTLDKICSRFYWQSMVNISVNMLKNDPSVSDGLQSRGVARK